jgi:bacterioferritin (cytochrome b1)
MPKIQMPLKALGEEEYKQFVSDSFSSLISDEVSASILYLIVSNFLGVSLGKVLKEHSAEEHEHASKLIDYAINHGIVFDITLRENDNIDYSVQGLLQYVEKLEEDAIQDYKTMSLVANKYGDVELYELMKDIMMNETEHYDELSIYINKIRKIGYVKVSDTVMIADDAEK